MARPHKLTPEVEERMVRAISVGAAYKDACAYAGISYQTFLNWKKRAQQSEARSDDGCDEPEETTRRFVEFFDRIKKAQGDAAMSWLATINKAAKRDWRAAAWALERRYPKSYDRNRLRPDRIDEVASRRTTDHAPLSGKDAFSEIAKILSDAGFLSS